jgi:hypothetical protein
MIFIVITTTTSATTSTTIIIINILITTLTVTIIIIIIIIIIIVLILTTPFTHHAGHPEQPDRVVWILRALGEAFPRLTPAEAPTATREQLEGFHTQKHVDKVGLTRCPIHPEASSAVGLSGVGRHSYSSGAWLGSVPLQSIAHVACRQGQGGLSTSTFRAVLWHLCAEPGHWHFSSYILRGGYLHWQMLKLFHLSKSRAAKGTCIQNQASPLPLVSYPAWRVLLLLGRFYRLTSALRILHRQMLKLFHLSKSRAAKGTGHLCKIDSDTIVMPHTGAAALRAAGAVSEQAPPHTSLTAES